MNAPLSGAKWVGDYQKLREVKAANPNALTVFRSHREDLYHWALTAGDPDRAAREYFAGFMDGTWWEQEFWRYCDVIEEFNEYTASSHTEDDKQVRIRWMEAVCREWNRLKAAHPNELGSGRPGGAIRLCMVNAPIGNDIDWRYAQIAAREGHYVGYHPYVLMNGGERDEADHRWHSMRWAYNDEEFVARGIRVNWLFTESGPFLDVVAGWRDARVCGGDIASYWYDAMVPFFQDLARTRAYNERRTGPVFVFTVSNDPTWRWYDLNESDIQYLVDRAREYNMPAPTGTGSAPPPPPPTGGNVTTLGVDVSRWQGDINWQQMADRGVKFAFIKLTENTTWIDTMAGANMDGAEDAGILRGGYHFYRPLADWRAQAEHFCDVLEQVGPLELPPVIDLEIREGANSNLAARVRAFAELVTQRIGRRPIIYTNFYYANDYLQGLGDYDLWIAQYTDRVAPAIPTNIWQAWKFWQYTSSGDGRWYGASSATLDLNRFNGDEAALRAYAGAPQEPPPPSDTFVLSSPYNLRSAPRTDPDARIITLPAGTRLRVIGEAEGQVVNGSGRWLLVAAYVHEGAQG